MNRLPTAKLSPIAQTLLIPLYYRAAENHRKDALLRDSFAEEVLNRLNVDMSWLDHAAVFTRISALLRMRKFDRSVVGFAEQHPNGLVVEIGCGLDTRWQRLNLKGIRWLLIDLPEVMELRARIMGAEEGVRRIGASALDFSWLEALTDSEPQDVYIIAEGVVTYFQESQVRALVCELANRLPGCRLTFDALPTWMASLGSHPVLKKAQTQMSWGLDNPHRIEAWHEGIRLIEEWHYFKEPEGRLWFYNLSRFFPPFAHGFRVVTYQLAG